MNTNIIKKLVATFAVIVLTLFVGAFSADASVIWADGNVSNVGSSVGIGQCSLVSVGNHTTQVGVQSGTTGEPCWATSIPPVQPGEEFALLVKYKNIGTEMANNVTVRVTPNGSSAPTTSKTFNVALIGVTPAPLPMPVVKTDSVTVNLASAQTITVTGVTHYPAPYTTATGSISQSGLFGAGAAVSNVGPNQFGYVRIRFVVSNTQQGQAPSVTTNNPNVTQSSVTFNGNCDANGLSTSTWFEYRNQNNGSTQTTNTINRNTQCGNFSEQRTLSAGNYEYRAMAQNSAGSDQGAWVAFTIAGAQQGQAPTITTGTPTVPPSAPYNVTFRTATYSPNNSPTTVHFEYRTIGGYANSTNPLPRGLSSTPPTQFQLLNPGNYEYRAMAQNANGSAQGSWVPFTVGNSNPNPNPNGTLDVVTTPESNVGTSSATLNGRVNDNGSGNAQADFIYASDEIGSSAYVSDSAFLCFTYGNPNIRSTPDGVYGDNTPYSETITNLSANTEYKYRACVIDSSGARDTGSIERFITSGAQQNNGVLDVSTSPESNVDADSATLNGYLVNDGTGSPSLSFVYANDNPGSNAFVNDAYFTCSSNNSNVNSINVSGSYSDGSSFSRSLTGLSVNTSYKYRACAQDGNTSDQGAIERFRTDAEDDTTNDDDGVKTTSATNVEETSAYLNGTIDQGDNFDAVWFVLSRTDSTPDCDSGDDYQVSGSNWDEGDDFEKRITGLREDTRYYFRACAERDGDEFEGSVKNFTTDGDVAGPIDDGGIDPVTPVSIQTLPTTGVTQNNAIVNGSYNANGCSDLRTYFLTGTTPYSMTTQTSVIQRGNTSGIAREELGNLTPGASYYTQFIGICKGKVYSGDIKSFTVPGVKIQTPVKVPAPKVITNTPAATVTGSGTGCLDLLITNDVENVTPGQPLTYRVNWENTCNQDLENAILSIKFPKEIKVLTTSHGQFAGTTENAVIMELDKIRKDQNDFAIITAQVARNAKIGELAVVQADFGARGDTMDQNISATAFDVDQVFIASSNLGAFALGSGFLGGPLGWLIVLAIIVLIVLLARAIYLAGAKDQHRRGMYAPVYAAAGHQYPGAMYHHNPTVAMPQNVVPMQMPADPNAYTLYRPVPPQA